MGHFFSFRCCIQTYNPLYCVETPIMCVCKQSCLQLLLIGKRSLDWPGKISSLFLFPSHFHNIFGNTEQTRTVTWKCLEGTRVSSWIGCWNPPNTGWHGGRQKDKQTSTNTLDRQRVKRHRMDRNGLKFKEHPIFCEINATPMNNSWWGITFRLSLHYVWCI